MNKRIEEHKQPSSQLIYADIVKHKHTKRVRFENKDKQK